MTWFFEIYGFLDVFGDPPWLKKPASTEIRILSVAHIPFLNLPQGRNTLCIHGWFLYVFVEFLNLLKELICTHGCLEFYSLNI